MWTLWIPAQAAPIVDRPVPAAGAHDVVVTIPAFGRYAVEVRSSTGTALQLTDRDAGPGPTSGQVGELDGRVDAFFDRGEVRVRTIGAVGATGDARLTVTPFDDRGADAVLPLHARVEAELTDRSARGWWIDLHEPGPLAIEAVGRHLGDLRAWKDGTWLLDPRTACSPVEPEEGRPQTRCTLTGALEPGLVRIVAYGAPGRPWANEAPDQQLTVSRDVPDLPAAGRRVARIGPTGVERFRVPAGVDTAHLALPEIARASVSLQPWSAADPFDGWGTTATIDDASRTPEATARRGHSGPQVLTVRGAPGQRYALDWFTSTATSAALSGTGRTLIATLSTARPSDEHVTTGLITRTTRAGVQLERAAVIPARGTWTQRFNLLKTTKLLVEVAAGGIDVAVDEGEVDLVVHRWFATRPDGFRAPEPRRDQWKETVEPGIYVVELRPRTPGVAAVRIGRGAPVSVRPGLLEIVELDPAYPFGLSLAPPPNHPVGLVTRSLPLDPREPVPLPLGAKDAFTVPIALDRPAVLRATGPDGEPLRLTAHDRTGTEISLPAGSFAVTVHHDGDQPTVAVLGVAPEPEPTPTLPAGRLRALPTFTKLTPDAPWYGELAAGRTQVFALDLPRAGVWTLESTGLLSTSGTLRSRVQLDLGSGSANGVGRNFRVSRGLPAGAYQASVTTNGASAGHLGVRLVEAPTRDGGALEDGVTARATLAPGEALAYRFDVAEPGRWQIRSTGPGQAFACRLEDAEGWPVVAPASRCELGVDLTPGTWVLRALPEAVETRRLTSVRRVRPTEMRAGHGPFALPPGVAASHVWEEPPGDSERPVDRWTLDVPADAVVSASAGAEMGGRLVCGGTEVGRLIPGEDWTGPLKRGACELELRAARRGTGVAYSVRWSADALLPGQRQSVRLPASIALRTGAPGPYVLASTGQTDVRARLLDATGAVVAANDDRPDDWNFRIATWLPAGDWTLELAAVDRGGTTQLAFDAPAERDAEPLRPTGKPVAVTVGADSALHPLELPKGRELVRVQVTADVALSLAIEAERDGTWRALASDAGRELDLVARRIPGQPVRLRLTSLDGRTATATLTVDDPNPGKRAEAALASGLGAGRSFASLGGLTPGLFRVAAGSAAVCARPGAPCERAPGVVALDADGVLVSDGATLVRADLTRPVPIELSPTPRALGADARGLIAVEVRSATGLPGAALSDGATAIGDRAAIAIGSGEARLSGDGVGRVRVVPLTRARQPWDRETPLRLEVPPGHALEIPLGRGTDTVEIALERGLVARSGGAALWADRDSARGLLPGADALIVANPSDRPAFAEVRPAQALPSGTIERYADRAGRLVVPVPHGDGRLRVAGATLHYARADGRVLAGDDLPVGPGGFATIAHGTGHLASWVEGPAGPWPTGSTGTTPLVATPGVHRVHVDRPYAARIRGSGPERVLWRPHGGPFDVVASSRAEIEVRALDGGAPVARIEPAHAPGIGEGVGPEVLVDAGGARWFRFEVAQAGPVGFGVRASSDRVTARVHAADGAELASGVVGRVELTPGSYLLALTQSPDAAPVRARPALVGVDPPDTGPPGDVVDAFVRAGGAR